MIPTYTKAILRQDVLDNVKGNPDTNNATTVIDRLMNRAVNDVLSGSGGVKGVDTRSTKRKFRLSISHANDVIYDDSDGSYDLPESVAVATQSNQYEFHCPIDLKGSKVIDVVKRTDRPIDAQYSLTDEEEFDRRKTIDGFLMALSDNSLERRLLVSGIPSINTATVESLDTATGWTAVGGASNVATTTDDFVEGNGAVTFDSDMGSATAGIVKSTVTQVDVSAYEDHSFYVWVKIPASADITDFKLRIGSDSSNYIEMTVTHTTDLLTFYDGWNLLRFDWDDDATTTGTPSMTAVDYVRFIMDKDTAKAAATGWVVDAIIAAQDSLRDVLYYSKYPWMSSDGVFKLQSDDDSDFLVCDSDEYAMFVDRCSEYVSRRLGNDKDEAKHKNNFAGDVETYRMQYPSEAQPLTTHYEHIASAGDSVGNSGAISTN